MQEKVYPEDRKEIVFVMDCHTVSCQIVGDVLRIRTDGRLLVQPVSYNGIDVKEIP